MMSARNDQVHPPSESKMSQTVRVAVVCVKEQGGLGSLLWKPKCIVLTEDTLTIDKLVIPLSDIGSLERTDVKPFCLTLNTSSRTFNLSFETDSELCDWQDDLYLRSPLSASCSPPSEFVHRIHVSLDPNSGDFTGLPTQWEHILAVPSASLSQVTAKSHTRTMSAPPDIPSSPISPPTAPRSTSSSGVDIILTGRAGMKGDTFLSGWKWGSTRLSLTERALIIDRSMLIRRRIRVSLHDVTKVERTDIGQCCLLLETPKRRYLLSFKTDSELYDWLDGIYMRGPGLGIGQPTFFAHHVHVGIDPVTKNFTGLPEPWRKLLSRTSSVAQKRMSKLSTMRVAGLAQRRTHSKTGKSLDSGIRSYSVGSSSASTLVDPNRSSGVPGV
ncbi:hypothetical protein BD779DRAFT_1550466 [Infundibulicybe gibba]|nr:hypothetical protein BD779DRAFT_1550466 [Infundibulicybe gibba]